MSKAADDQELRKLAADFFSAAWKARFKSIDDVKERIRTLGLRTIDNASFSNGPEVMSLWTL